MPKQRKSRLQEKPQSQLEKVAEEIRVSFSSQDARREQTLKLCREVIRYSAGAIRAVHRRENPQARQFLRSAEHICQELEPIFKDYPELRYSGFVHDAHKEYVEASVTLALVNREPLPEPGTLGVNYPAYLNGLGEATGELRRYVLDSLRQNDLGRCEELLHEMDEIYGALVTMDFPDAVTYSLRRTTDMVRGILEKTRSDLTLILRQNKLEERLGQFEENQGKTN